MSNTLNQLFGKQVAVAEGAAHPVAVSDDEFETMVLGADVPVLVDFWSPSCMPCLMLAPTLEKIAAEYDGQALIAKVDVGQHQRWAARYGIQAIPTLLFVKNGHVVGRAVGLQPEGALKRQLDQML
jgi:thioredoxin 1